MISGVLVFLAAFFNAVMDRVEYGVAFRASVFSRLNPKFWQKDISWQYAKKVFGWKFDAWHVAKSTMVVLLCFSIVLYSPVISPLIDFLIAGATWNLSFNIFYNKILKR